MSMHRFVLLLTLAAQSCAGMPALAVDKWVITERLDGTHVNPVVPPTPQPNPQPQPDNSRIEKELAELLVMVRHQNEIIDELKKRFGEQSPPRPPQAFYPVRATRWTHPGPSTAENLVKHLEQGEHAGQFDPEWLRSLGVEQLESLHSDSHEKRVNWNYAKHGRQAMPAAAVYVPAPACPGGWCPVPASLPQANKWDTLQQKARQLRG